MRKIMKIVVNLLTTARLILTILLMLLFKNISEIKFLIYITILFLTDFIDGKLARSFQVQTVYGANMDSIADKSLSIGLMLLILKKIPSIWLPLIGEILISSINIIGKIYGKKTNSRIIGKVKTWFISITIIICYINYFNISGNDLVWISCIITLMLQIGVTLDYIYYLKHQKKQELKQKENTENNIFYRLFSTEYYLKNN